MQTNSGFFFFFFWSIDVNFIATSMSFIPENDAEKKTTSVFQFFFQRLLISMWVCAWYQSHIEHRKAKKNKYPVSHSNFPKWKIYVTHVSFCICILAGLLIYFIRRN